MDENERRAEEFREQFFEKIPRSRKSIFGSAVCLLVRDTPLGDGLPGDYIFDETGSFEGQLESIRFRLKHGLEPLLGKEWENRCRSLENHTDSVAAGEWLSTAICPEWLKTVLTIKEQKRHLLALGIWVVHSLDVLDSAIKTANSNVIISASIWLGQADQRYWAQWNLIQQSSTEHPANMNAKKSEKRAESLKKWAPKWDAFITQKIENDGVLYVAACESCAKWFKEEMGPTFKASAGFIMSAVPNRWKAQKRSKNKG